ncbi:MAG: FkbM family methyltransferase [Bacteroidota bacterium]
MKNLIKTILQKLLGFETYLYWFSLYIIKTLKRNKKEGDFVYFRDMVADGNIILDIGANIGAMAVHLSRTHPHATIYAFEPIPQNIKTLERVLRHFKIKNVSVVKSALGNTTGEIEMVMPVQKKAKLQGLSHVVHDSITDFNEGEKYKTPLTTLDIFLKENKITQAVNAIKLDVENFEFFVLEGGIETIKKHRPIIYTELWENENRENCFTFIKNLNYTVKVLTENELVDFDEKLHSTQNFFFIP